MGNTRSLAYVHQTRCFCSPCYHICVMPLDSQMSDVTCLPLGLTITSSRDGCRFIFRLGKAFTSLHPLSNRHKQNHVNPYPISLVRRTVVAYWPSRPDYSTTEAAVPSSIIAYNPSDPNFSKDQVPDSNKLRRITLISVEPG